MPRLATDWNDELVELVRRRSLAVLQRRSISVVRGRSLCVAGRHRHGGREHRRSSSVVRGPSLSMSETHCDDDERRHRDGQSLSPQQWLWLFVLLPIAMLLTIYILMSLPKLESPSNQEAPYTCPNCGWPDRR